MTHVIVIIYIGLGDPPTCWTFADAASLREHADMIASRGLEAPDAGSWQRLAGLAEDGATSARIGSHYLRRTKLH